MPKAAASLGVRTCTGSPSHNIWPPSGEWMPAMHLMSTDLPAPLSPARAVTWPPGTSRFMSTSACTAPKFLSMPRSSSNACPALAGLDPAGADRTGLVNAVLPSTPCSRPRRAPCRPCRRHRPPLPQAATAAVGPGPRPTYAWRGPFPPTGCAQLIPLVEQALATAETHRSEAFTAPSFTTVDAMFWAVTQTGVSSTELTSALAVVSLVVPFRRVDGAVWPARRYRAMAAAA